MSVDSEKEIVFEKNGDIKLYKSKEKNIYELVLNFSCNYKTIALLISKTEYRFRFLPPTFSAKLLNSSNMILRTSIYNQMYLFQIFKFYENNTFVIRYESCFNDKLKKLFYVEEKVCFVSENECMYTINSNFEFKKTLNNYLNRYIARQILYLKKTFLETAELIESGKISIDNIKNNPNSFKPMEQFNNSNFNNFISSNNRFLSKNIHEIYYSKSFMSGETKPDEIYFFVGNIAMLIFLRFILKKFRFG